MLLVISTQVLYNFDIFALKGLGVGVRVAVNKTFMSCQKQIVKNK